DGIRDATVTGVQTCALPILLTQGLRDRLHRLRGSVEGSERLHGFTVFHQLEDTEEADRPREADRWMLPPELLVVALHHLAHAAQIGRASCRESGGSVVGGGS